MANNDLSNRIDALLESAFESIVALEDEESHFPPGVLGRLEAWLESLPVEDLELIDKLRATELLTPSTIPNAAMRKRAAEIHSKLQSIITSGDVSNGTQG